VQQQPPGRRYLPLSGVVVAAGVAVISVGCGAGGDGKASKPLAVRTEVVQSRPFAERVEAIATLEADRVVQLASQVTGRVTQLLVRQGQAVAANQVVLVLDQSQLQAELASLRAQMLTDKLNADRYESLVREGAASAIQRDQFRQTALASRQALIARQADLAYRTVRAPQAGIIGEINLKRGDVLQAGAPFTQLVSNHSLNAEIELPANQAARVRVGLPVVLHTPGHGGAELRSRITAVEPAVAASTQLLMAQAPVPRMGGNQWLNGMRLRAEVILDQRQQLAIPLTSVTRLAGQSFVFVVGSRDQLLQLPGRLDRQRLKTYSPGTLFALQLPVQLGAPEGNRYPVIAGLKPGQRVITTGLLQLRHGMPVKPD